MPPPAMRGADLEGGRRITQIDWLNPSCPNDSPSSNGKSTGPSKSSRNTAIVKSIPGKIIKKRKSPNGDTAADVVRNGNSIAIRPGAQGTTIPSKTFMTKHDANLENAKSKQPISTRSGVAYFNSKTRYTDLEGTGGIVESGQQKVSIDVLLRVKHESPWKIYNHLYELDEGRVSVAERKRPAYGLVAIRRFSGAGAESRLATLRRVRGEYLIKCMSVFLFDDVFHVVFEHMPVTLVQIVGVPKYPEKNQVAAIVAQVLAGVEFLESHYMLHGSLTCSNVLLNEGGDVKIANLEHCSIVSKEDEPDRRDVQALGDMMMQLLEKRRKNGALIDVASLRCGSPTVAEFLLITTSASIKELAQHAFLDDWRKEDLIGLVSLVQVPPRRYYKIGQ